MNARTMRVAVAALLLLTATAAEAVTWCSAKIRQTDGVVLVSAEGLDGTASWGTEAGGPYEGGFYNSTPANCRPAEGAVMSRCALSDVAPEKLTPPLNCTVVVKDDAGECVARVRYCTPRAPSLDLEQEDAETLESLLAHLVVGPEKAWDEAGNEFFVQTARLTSINVAIDNGVDPEWGGTQTSNGKGNLSLGKSECNSPPCERTASHSLMIGEDYRNGGFTNLNVGDNNITDGDTTVAIGIDHEVRGYYNAAIVGIGHTVGGEEIEGGGPIYAGCFGGVGCANFAYGGGIFGGRNNRLLGDATNAWAAAAVIAGGTDFTSRAEGSTAVGASNGSIGPNAIGAVVDKPLGGAATVPFQNVD